VRIAVDWLLRSDIGEVIKTIVDDEGAFSDYARRKDPTGQEKAHGKESEQMNFGPRSLNRSPFPFDR